MHQDKFIKICKRLIRKIRNGEILIISVFQYFYDITFRTYYKTFVKCLHYEDKAKERSTFQLFTKVNY